MRGCGEEADGEFVAVFGAHGFAAVFADAGFGVDAAERRHVGGGYCEQATVSDCLNCTVQVWNGRAERVDVHYVKAFFGGTMFSQQMICVYMLN